ncbi:MAG: hypothetical protein IKM24_10465 [Clostridia bacterium]|nr:hypothetical protein [Clostridia bacterium]
MKKIFSVLMAVVIMCTCAYGAFALDVAVDAPVADDATFNYKPGDLNNDGIVAPDDARSALRYAVGLENWNTIEQRCYNAKTYNFRLAADINYDGFVSVSDARTILRIAVGLETVDYENLNTLTTTQQILEFYNRAVHAVKVGGSAGYTKTAWQSVDENQKILDVCNGKFFDHVNTYITSEGEAKGVVYGIGTKNARCTFPDFSMNDYSKVRSATCTVNPAGNYVMTIVLADSDTTRIDNGSFIFRATDQHITWKEDVEPALASSSHITNWKGENVTTKNFTIIAELTPNGKFLSLTHQADAVLSVEELLTNQLLVIPVTYNNVSAVVHTKTVYNNFNYSSHFKGINYKTPAAYGTIEDIGDYLGGLINEIAYYAKAGYTKTTSQSIDADNTKLNCTTDRKVKSYLKSSTLTTEKGTQAAWANFPPFDLYKYDWVESASCTVNENGNYVFVMTFHDIDTSSSEKYNVLQSVTEDLIYFDADIAPVIREIGSLAYDANGTVTYQDFTIVAEVTPDGQITYMKQSAKVTAYTSFIKTRLGNHKDQKLTLDIANEYTNFTY